jgi:hypothetical protein
MRSRGRRSRTSSLAENTGSETVTAIHHNTVGQQHGKTDIVGDLDHRVASSANFHQRVCGCARVQCIKKGAKGSSINSTLGCMAGRRRCDTLFHPSGDFAGAFVAWRASYFLVQDVLNPFAHLLACFLTLKTLAVARRSQ